jgi:hypothetical protein
MSTPFAPDHVPLIASRLGRGRCHRSRVPSPTDNGPDGPTRDPVASPVPDRAITRKCRSDCQSRAAPVRPSRALDNDGLRSMVEGRTPGEDAVPVVDRTRTWSAIWTGAKPRTGPARRHESAPGDCPRTTLGTPRERPRMPGTGASFREPGSYSLPAVRPAGLYSSAAGRQAGWIEPRSRCRAASASPRSARAIRLRSRCPAIRRSVGK